MGAPKQKWTQEEEAALKAGVIKHGAGKWRTILTDEEFSSILKLRSNVDLKDKWRNINVTAIWGSRQKAKLALKRIESPEPLAEYPGTQDNEEIDNTKPLLITEGTVKNTYGKEPNVRLDKLIAQAITNLKEPRGSDRAAITAYIEKHYWAPEDLNKMLATKLKHMTAHRKLIKVKHRYRIASNAKGVEKRRSLSMLPHMTPKDSPRPEKNDVNVLTKAQVDDDLNKMRSLTAHEAAAAAALAVAEAEAAIAAAEEAEREAEAAELEAEAAQIFAKAAMKAFKCKTLLSW